MRTVILSGGMGTRLAEESQTRPKPMVEIGGRPILWHIMKIYAAHGFKEFMVALGYKGEVIKSYFLDYYFLRNSFTLDLGTNRLDGGTFMMTYGDGVARIDVRALVEFHRRHGKLATVTAVRPPARFGGLSFDGDRVVCFSEKPQVGEGWINGGFFVLEPEVLDYIDGDQTPFERAPLERLAADGELMAYRHE